MLRVLVLSIIALSESVNAGYDYPKPFVPFELPNNHENLQDFGGQIVQDISNQRDQKISYFAPYEDYFYSKLYENNRSGNNVVHSVGSTINSEHQNPKISTLQDLTSLTPITTELNANIDASLPIQSSVVQRPVISDSKPINVQPILNEPTYSLISPETVPLINLLSTDSETLNSENVHNVDSNLISLTNNIPLEFNIKNSNANSNDAESDLNPSDHLASNVQGTALPTLDEQNALTPLINVQHSDSSLKSTNPSVQEVTPTLYTSSYSTQNDLSDNLNEKMNQFSLNLPQEKSQLFVNQNNPTAFVYQNQFNGIHSDANQIENKQKSPTPVVTKHVYFHVPPPDMEELPVVRDQPTPKKNYKIIFITLPAQEPKNKELQAALYNNNNQVAYNEEKTLIYVLVNNTEPSQIVLPEPKRSEHEVLFVKYRDNRFIKKEEEGPFIKTNSDSGFVTSGAGLVNGNR